MTRTSRYLNQDTIVALQSFQIKKNDCEITDYLDTNNKMNSYHFEYCPKYRCYHSCLLRVVLPTLVSKCFVVKNAENVLL